MGRRGEIVSLVAFRVWRSLEGLFPLSEWLDVMGPW